MMDDATARLVVRQGPNPNVEYPLTRSKMIIGRTQDNDIAVADPEVSRQHAQVILHEGGFAIEDLESTNGTFINGLRAIGMTPLNHGDTIELGEAIQLLFLSHWAGVEPAAPGADFAQHAKGMSAGEPTAPILSDPPGWSRERDQEYVQPRPKRVTSDRRRWFLGCGCGFLLAIFLCAAALFFLDAYDGGRLLYCGPAQPLFETLLGPFGFSPACALG